MSSFLNQVGQFSQSFGQSINQTIGQGIGNGINQINEELRIGKYTVLVKDRIAEGGFGVIDLVSEIHSHQEYVLKRCNIDRQEVFDIVKKEISILQEFGGPYVVKLVDSAIFERSTRSKEALLLLEYYPGGHLLERLNKRNGVHLPIDSIYRTFGYILLGVKPFHEHYPVIIHRDLKLENILFAPDGKARLCDFGSCKEGPIFVRNSAEREVAEESIQKETTQMYRAPEMVNLYMREALTEKTDIWALGCILYSLCFLKHPFQDQSSLAIIAGKFQFPKDSPFPLEVNELILRMLDVDPEARSTVDELLHCVVELAAGRSLPAYSLSPEALRRREERLEADKLRDNKNKKKPTSCGTANNFRKAVPMADSVAARRLAAKRGQSSKTNESAGDAFVSSNDFTSYGTSSEVREYTDRETSEFDFSADFDTHINVAHDNSTVEHYGHQTTTIHDSNNEGFTFDNSWLEFEAVEEPEVSSHVATTTATSNHDRSPSLLDIHANFDNFDNFVNTDSGVKTQKAVSVFDQQPDLLLLDPKPLQQVKPQNNFSNDFDLFNVEIKQQPVANKSLNLSDPSLLLRLYDHPPADKAITPNVPYQTTNRPMGIPIQSNENRYGQPYHTTSTPNYQTTANVSKPYQTKRSDPFDSLNILRK